MIQIPISTSNYDSVVHVESKVVCTPAITSSCIHGQRVSLPKVTIMSHCMAKHRGLKPRSFKLLRLSRLSPRRAAPSKFRWVDSCRYDSCFNCDQKVNSKRCEKKIDLLLSGGICRLWTSVGSGYSLVN